MFKKKKMKNSPFTVKFTTDLFSESLSHHYIIDRYVRNIYFIMFRACNKTTRVNVRFLVNNTIFV